MKGAILLMIGIMAGCGPLPTLEELELQALASGDWTAVERRERLMARRAAQHGPSCPGQLVAICQSYGAMDRCSCVTRSELRDMFDSRD